MLPALIPYISRYYDDWRRSSRRWCSLLGILPDADDVLSDVLESLCRRPEAFQLDLLAHEQAGERPLLFYVLGALRKMALLYRKRKYRMPFPIDDIANLSGLIENDGADTEVSAELFAAFREVEAAFRGDDFIDAGPQYSGNGYLCRYVVGRKRKHSCSPSVRYRVRTPDGCIGGFSRRNSAIAFLAGRKFPPPEKSDGQSTEKSE